MPRNHILQHTRINYFPYTPWHPHNQSPTDLLLCELAHYRDRPTHQLRDDFLEILVTLLNGAAVGRLHVGMVVGGGSPTYMYRGEWWATYTYAQGEWWAAYTHVQG